MRENGGSVDIIVAMNGIDAIDDRNTKPGGKSTLLHLSDHVHPGLCRSLRSRHAASPT